MHLIVGFNASMFEAFQARGGKVTAWIQTARSPDALLRPEGVETHYWGDLVNSDVQLEFHPALDPQLATRVRDLAYPYFIRAQDRVNFQQNMPYGSWLDGVNKLEMMIHFYYGLLVRNGIRHVISSNVPHEGSHIVLYFLAREMGLTNIVTTQSLFSNAFWIVTDFADLGTYKTGIARDFPRIPIEPKPRKPFYMGALPDMTLKYHLWRVVETSAKIAFKAPMAALGFRRRTYRKSIYKLKDRLGRYTLHRCSQLEGPVAGERYVYFPLHLQPEMTTDTIGHQYADQLLAVEELVRRLPDDVHVYLKENPKQSSHTREPSFLKRLSRIPRTRYLPIQVDSFELIRGCEAVATITGTAGWEAIQMGKPAICFGDAWYKALSGAFPWDMSFDYSKIESYRFDAGRVQAEFDGICRYLRKGMVDPDYLVLISEEERRTVAETTMGNILEFIDDLERGGSDEAQADMANAARLQGT